MKAFVGAAISNPSVTFLKGTDKELKEQIKKIYGKISAPYLGLQFQKRLHKNLSFNIDFQSCIKGQTVVERTNFYYKVIYLDFIPSIDFNLGNHFKIGAGPYISSKIKDITKRPPVANELGRRDWDYGFIKSITVEINRLAFRLSYLYGLYETFVGLPDRYKHRVLQFGIGYSLS